MTDKKLTDSEITINALKKILDLMLCEGDLQRASTVSHTIDLINRQKAENDDLFYKLTGVMHSVDKWLDGDELEQDEVNRAATMREKTLKITEDLQAENERLKKFLDMSRKVSLARRDRNLKICELNQKILEELKTAKAEAYKEFAEKLHEELRMYGIKDKFNKLVFLNVVDKAKKELVGENDG